MWDLRWLCMSLYSQMWPDWWVDIHQSFGGTYYLRFQSIVFHFSGTSVNIYCSTWHHISEESNLLLSRHDITADVETVSLHNVRVKQHGTQLNLYFNRKASKVWHGKQSVHELTLIEQDWFAVLRRENRNKFGVKLGYHIHTWANHFAVHISATSLGYARV
jgi:hypothetical protein